MQDELANVAKKKCSPKEDVKSQVFSDLHIHIFFGFQHCQSQPVQASNLDLYFLHVRLSRDL